MAVNVYSRTNESPYSPSRKGSQDSQDSQYSQDPQVEGEDQAYDYGHTEHDFSTIGTWVENTTYIPGMYDVAYNYTYTDQDLLAIGDWAKTEEESGSAERERKKPRRRDATEDELRAIGGWIQDSGR